MAMLGNMTSDEWAGPQAPIFSNESLRLDR
jgi:hypothetical protein